MQNSHCLPCTCAIHFAFVFLWYATNSIGCQGFIGPISHAKPPVRQRLRKLFSKMVPTPFVPIRCNALKSLRAMDGARYALKNPPFVPVWMAGQQCYHRLLRASRKYPSRIMLHGTIVRVRAVRGLTTLLSLCVVQPVEAEKKTRGQRAVTYTNGQQHLRSRIVWMNGQSSAPQQLIESGEPQWYG